MIAVRTGLHAVLVNVAEDLKLSPLHRFAQSAHPLFRPGHIMDNRKEHASGLG